MRLERQEVLGPGVPRAGDQDLPGGLWEPVKALGFSENALWQGGGKTRQTAVVHPRSPLQSPVTARGGTFLKGSEVLSAPSMQRSPLAFIIA